MAAGFWCLRRANLNSAYLVKSLFDKYFLLIGSLLPADPKHTVYVSVASVFSR